MYYQKCIHWIMYYRREVDAFLVVLITLPVPIFISTYYVPPKSSST
jgi:hypothetical protein